MTVWSVIGTILLGLAALTVLVLVSAVITAEEDLEDE